MSNAAGRSGSHLPETVDFCSSDETAGTTRHNSGVRVLGADLALLRLIEEWLGPHGYNVTGEAQEECSPCPGLALIIVDVPFEREAGIALLQRVARKYPAVPVIAMSAKVFASVSSNGTVARALGVAGVLPKPVSRDALIALVQELVQPPLR